jgi:hypothetical protein
MAEVEIRGLDELVWKLKALGAARIPNYLARAINEVAAEAQKAMITETQAGLTVRGTWFKTGTRFGFNRNPATKDKLEATVFTRAPWMEAQEFQTFKTARKSSFMAVPLTPVRAGRTDPKKIPARLTPKALGPKLFKMQTKHGILLAQRMKRAGLRIMYTLERIVHYPRRVHVVDAGAKAAKASAVKAVENQIDAAIRKQGLK